MLTSPYQKASFTPAADPLRWFLQVLDFPGYWQRDAARCLLLFGQFTLGYGALLAIGYGFSLGEGAIVVFWPAAGLLAAVLTCTPPRTWPLWIAGTLVGRILFDVAILDDRDIAVSMGFGTVSAIEGLILASLMRKPMEQSYRLGRPLYMLTALLLIAAAACAVGGLLGAGLVDWLLATKNAAYWDSWRIWFAADYLGVIVVAPGMAWLLLPQIRLSVPWPRATDIGILVALCTIAATAAFSDLGRDSAYVAATTALVVLLIALPMFWAIVRFVFPVAAAVQLLFVLLVTGAAARGYGPFALPESDPLPVMTGMQIYLIVSVVCVMSLAFLLMERRQAAHELRMHRGIGNVLVTLTDKLVNAAAGNVDESIEQVLAEIAGFANADRCVLMRIDRRTLQVQATHRWTRPQAGEHPPELLQADLREFPWVLEQFASKGYVVIDNFSKELPEGAEELRSIQRAAPETAAAVYMGLFTDGELVGAIGCGYRSRGVRWNRESLSLMYLIGQLFANILDRKNAENSLQLYQDKLRSLAAEVTLSEERARRRAATDLHDGIGQNLAVSRMKIGQLLSASEDPPEELRQLRNLIDESLRGTRYIIADLSPSILYELGLVPALQSLAERFETANDLGCSVEEKGDPWIPGNDMRIALYRSVQEFLNNIARHAQAETVRIVIAWSADRVNITVVDDGIGFDAEEALQFVPQQSGFGLFSVREALALVGGRLTIESSPGLGTTVTLSVPRPPVEEPA